MLPRNLNVNWVAPQTTPSLTSVWRGHGEEVEMSRVWMCELKRWPEWRAGTADLLKSLQARTNVLIGPSSKTLRMLSVCLHTHSTVTLDFPRAGKGPHPDLWLESEKRIIKHFIQANYTGEFISPCHVCVWHVVINLQNLQFDGKFDVTKYSLKFPSFTVAVLRTGQN